MLSRGVGLRGFESHPPHQERYPLQSKVLEHVFFLKKEGYQEYHYFENEALRGLQEGWTSPELVVKKLEFSQGSSMPALLDSLPSVLRECRV